MDSIKVSPLSITDVISKVYNKTDSLDNSKDEDKLELLQQVILDKDKFLGFEILSESDGIKVPKNVKIRSCCF